MGWQGRSGSGSVPAFAFACRSGSHRLDAALLDRLMQFAAGLRPPSRGCTSGNHDEYLVSQATIRL